MSGDDDKPTPRTPGYVPGGGSAGARGLAERMLARVIVASQYKPVRVALKVAANVAVATINAGKAVAGIGKPKPPKP